MFESHSLTLEITSIYESLIIRVQIFLYEIFSLKNKQTHGQITALNYFQQFI